MSLKTDKLRTGDVFWTAGMACLTGQIVKIVVLLGKTATGSYSETIYISFCARRYMISERYETFKLHEKQYQELLRLCGLYRREAKGCMEGKSYLAGCVMIGAALEADLIATCHCFSDKIPSELIPRKKNSKPKHLLKWSLFELLRVARECGWLPSGLSLDEEWNHQKAHVGDYAQVVREIRNLIHANRYIIDFPQDRVSQSAGWNCASRLSMW